MKKNLGVILFVAFCAVAAAEVLGATPGTLTGIIGGGSGMLFATVTPVTLSTQKIVFLTSLKEEYDQIDTWLAEAEDLSSFVEDGQTLVFPEAGADPEVYKNSVTDISSVEPEETTHKEELDVYDSQNYKIRNIKLHALPFDKVQYYTKKSSDAIIKKEIADAAYAFAPETSGHKKIVFGTQGGAVRNGLFSLTLDDIIKLATAADNAKFPDGRNLVLPSDMWWDLVNNNPILKGQLERAPLTGTILPKIVEYYGFKIHKSLGDTLGVNWNLTENKKAAQGSIATGNVVPAALLFCKNQVFRAGGSYEMFYQDKSTNPTGRAYEFGFQHRFKSGFQMAAERYSGLIYLSKA